MKTYLLTVWTNEGNGETINLGRNRDANEVIERAAKLLARKWNENTWIWGQAGKFTATNGDWALVTVTLAS